MKLSYALKKVGYDVDTLAKGMRMTRQKLYTAIRQEKETVLAKIQHKINKALGVECDLLTEKGRQLFILLANEVLSRETRVKKLVKAYLLGEMRVLSLGPSIGMSPNLLAILLGSDRIMQTKSKEKVSLGVTYGRYRDIFDRDVKEVSEILCGEIQPRADYVRVVKHLLEDSKLSISRMCKDLKVSRRVLDKFFSHEYCKHEKKIEMGISKGYFRHKGNLFSANQNDFIGTVRSYPG